MSRSFGDIITQHKGIGPGFDFLRLALAIAILLAHVAAIAQTRGILGQLAEFTTTITTGETRPVERVVKPKPAADAPKLTNANNIPDMAGHEGGLSKPIVLSHVPMFFALSGFLVAGSAFRLRRVRPFLGMRFLRIFPALCVEVVLSAIVIGALFTTLRPMDYVTSPSFLSYFGNILGIVQMELPGVVFTKSGEQVAVNANLWTLPSEFYAYLILSFLMISGIVFKRSVFTFIFVSVSIAMLIANLAIGYNAVPGLSSQNNVYYFLMGLFFFLWRDSIPYNGWLVAMCALGSYLLITRPFGAYIAPPLLTYVTVYIGLTTIPKIPLLQSGDYSYGIYLYGFPITQVIVQTVPGMSGNFFALAGAAICCTALFAAFSWHVVEKPFLRFKRYLSAGAPAAVAQSATT